MLACVALTLILAELPQGLLALVGALHPALFYRIYVPLGDLWDLLVLLNSAANFVLYCTVNSQFRATLRALILTSWLPRCCCKYGSGVTRHNSDVIAVHEGAPWLHGVIPGSSTGSSVVLPCQRTGHQDVIRSQRSVRVIANQGAQRVDKVSLRRMNTL
jgi:hypothetical protein